MPIRPAGLLSAGHPATVMVLQETVAGQGKSTMPQGFPTPPGPGATAQDASQYASDKEDWIQAQPAGLSGIPLQRRTAMKRARTTFLRSGLIALLVGSSGFLAAQCTNNNVLTGSAVTPPCPGTTTVPCVQGGQYALVNVIAAISTPSAPVVPPSTRADHHLQQCRGPWLGYNDDACGLQSTLVWTATFTGQLRVLVDQYNCANNTTCARCR